ncbi:MAG: hypothetical protein M0033_05930 [Nitrospiraceae bacterium]|nr:hypothetical protein [Nitrospiraceae bacterium]MDA8325741.1 hypothetical protein [Nitrospiraceae bacterium]
MSGWLDEIAREMRPEDLPEGYQAVARVVGVENALKLSEELGGLPFYFPKIGSLIVKKRDQYIRQEFNGANYKELARKYGLTEVWVRRILHRRERGREGPAF